MSSRDAIRFFKQIYPENYILGSIEKVVDDKVILRSIFPDNTYYFVVSNNSVSHAYNTINEAEQSI